jgi:hypothetical protein
VETKASFAPFDASNPDIDTDVPFPDDSFKSPFSPDVHWSIESGEHSRFTYVDGIPLHNTLGQEKEDVNSEVESGSAGREDIRIRAHSRRPLLRAENK